jgi:hypothetical protein
MVIEKTLAIYKGEIYRSHFYFGFGTFLLFSSLFLFTFTQKIGWAYLSLGLFIFSIYSFSKGLYVNIAYRKRFAFYSGKEELSASEVKEEFTYNQIRINKRINNRRRYLYVMLIAIIIMIIGVLLNEKGLSIGTFVPIILVAATEFCETLLTEFRLWEYHRNLEKHLT